MIRHSKIVWTLTKENESDIYISLPLFRSLPISTFPPCLLPSRLLSSSISFSPSFLSLLSTHTHEYTYAVSLHVRVYVGRACLVCLISQLTTAEKGGYPQSKVYKQDPAIQIVTMFH